MPQPLVSVCIANYRGIELLGSCIESVRAQVCAADIEIIIHDDASDDGSVEYLRLHHPDLQLIASEQNVGFCIANNRMVQRAQGRYLLLLNNDARLFPDAITALLAEAERLQTPAILTLPQFDADSGELLDIGCRLDPFLNPVPQRKASSGDVGTVHGACLWIDKVLWEELGGFPEWFGSVGEDLYLCCRARLADYPVRALGVSGYHHHVGQSFGGGKIAAGRLATTFRRRALSERNKTFIMAMTLPSPWMQLLLPLHLTLLLAEGGVLSVLKMDSRYFSEIYWPAVVAFVRKIGMLGTCRALIMRHRRLAKTDFFAVFDPIPYKLRMLFQHGFPSLR